MTPPRRRDALLLAAGFGGAAALGTLLRPARSVQAAPTVNLEMLFPSSFGVWRVDALTQAFVRPAEQQGRRYSIYDQVLERTFVDEDGRRVMLSVASGNDRSTRMQLHLPEVCYRAAGYQIEPRGHAALPLAGVQLHATRLVARRPGRPEPITYWVVLGNRVLRDPDEFDARSAAFMGRHQPVDGMLVRVSSVDGDVSRAWTLHERFMKDLAAAMQPTALPKVFGTAPT